MDDVTADHSPPDPSRGATAPLARSSILTTALLRRGKERFSGTLRLEGGQRGHVIMRDGKVIAASTPVAPSIESLLLRSGRVSEAGWQDALEAAAPDGDMSAELAARGLLGATTIEVITQTAVFDAIFAIALGGISSCTAEPAGPGDLTPLMPADPGLDVDRVVRETSRRLNVAAEWDGLDPRIHSRPHRVGADANPSAGPGRAEILDKINGRWTTRDIAFNLGRGLFSVMTDLAVLVKDGLVVFEPPEDDASTAVQPAPEPAAEPVTEPKPSPGLPRRRPSRARETTPPDGTP